MIPQFIVQSLSNIPNSTSDTLKQIVRVVNNVQTQLDTILKYLTNKVQLDSVLLQQVSLKTGSNQIVHTLGRNLTGWQITRQRAAASIYDSQDSNSNPGSFLVLVSSAPVVVDLLVF